MSHFSRTQSDGTWTTGNYVPSESDFESLDAKQFAAIDGDNGGTWSPAANLVISGGLTFGLHVTGPTIVYGTGTLTGPVHLGAGDFPHLGAGHPGQTRVLVQDLSEAQGGYYPELDQALLASLPPALVWNEALGAMQTIATDVVDRQNAVSYSPKIVQELRVVDGSTLSQVEVRFVVATPRKAAPVTMPRARVYRLSASDNSKVVLTSAASGADASGYVTLAAPTSGPAWYAGGAAQPLVVPCDQNNAIDVSQHAYFLEILEEQGQSTAPMQAIREADATVAATGLYLTGNYDESHSGTPIDSPGGTNNIGARILTPSALPDSTFSGTTPMPQNAGIYVVQAPQTVAGSTINGEILRDPAFTGAQGTIVYIASGTLRGTLWFQQQAPGPIVLGQTPQLWSASLVGYGNVYTAASLTFTGITDTRWQ